MRGTSQVQVAAVEQVLMPPGQAIWRGAGAARVAVEEVLATPAAQVIRAAQPLQQRLITVCP